MDMHLLNEGEDPAKAGKVPHVGTPDQIAEKIQAVVDAGATYIIVYLPGLAYDQGMLRRFAETVIPRFR
jgi:alkanesulfonate monooxygenase SsuD/methylene tetrahydromethanopterin reductase-like flavin-dependent oxidoreductase (luciferase family)